MTFLGAKGSNTSDCIDIRTQTSWDEAMNEPIYVCTQTTSGGSNTNISIINPDELSNKNKVERKIFYYKGKYVNNYLKYTKDGTEHTMRILSVDTDDSITVVKNDMEYWSKKVNGTRVYYSDNSFNIIFNQSQSFTTLKQIEESVYLNNIYTKCNYYTGMLLYAGSYGYSSLGGLTLTQAHYDNTTECFKTDDESNYDQNWLGDDLEDYRYVHLKPCMKITSGTGAADNPFILESKCN